LQGGTFSAGPERIREVARLCVLGVNRQNGAVQRPRLVDAIYDKVGASASYICSGKYAAYHKVSKP
jgi:hypothetical protein